MTSSSGSSRIGRSTSPASAARSSCGQVLAGEVGDEVRGGVDRAAVDAVHLVGIRLHTATVAARRASLRGTVAGEQGPARRGRAGRIVSAGGGRTHRWGRWPSPSSDRRRGSWCSRWCCSTAHGPRCSPRSCGGACGASPWIARQGTRWWNGTTWCEDSFLARREWRYGPSAARPVCSLHGHIRRGAGLMVIRRFAGSDRFVGARPRSSRGIGNPSTIRRARPSVNRRVGRQGDDSRVFTIAWLNRHAASRRFRATAADIILGGGTTQHGTRRTSDGRPRPDRIPGARERADRGRGRHREPVDPVSGRRRRSRGEGQLRHLGHDRRAGRVDLSVGGVPTGWTAVLRGGGFTIDGVETDGTTATKVTPQRDRPGRRDRGRRQRIDVRGTRLGRVDDTLPVDIRVDAERGR